MRVRIDKRIYRDNDTESLNFCFGFLTPLPGDTLATLRVAMAKYAKSCAGALGAEDFSSVTASKIKSSKQHSTAHHRRGIALALM